MGVAHGHPHVAVAEKTGDDGQGNAVHRRLAGYSVAKVVQPRVLNARFAPYPIPEPRFARRRPGRVSDRRKHPGTISLLHPARDDLPGWAIQQDRSRPGLGVGEFQPVVPYLFPAEIHDLALAAAGEQQQTYDVGLLRLGRGAFSTSVEDMVKSGDFLAGEEPRHFPAGIAADAAHRVGLDMTESVGMVEDLPQQGEGGVGGPRRGPAASLEPAERHAAGDAVETPGAEGRKQPAVQRASEPFLCGRLAALETVRLPRTGDEVPEQRRLPAAGIVRIGGRGCRLHARAAYLLDLAERCRAERHFPNAPVRFAVIDEGPAAGGADPDPEPGHLRIPYGIFARLRPEPDNAGVGQSFPPRHLSVLPENGAESVGGLLDRTVGKVGVFERRLRVVVTQQPGRGRDGFAPHDGDAGICVSKIVKPDIANVRFLPDPPPERLEHRQGERPPPLLGREDPSALAREPLQDGPCGRRQPDRPGAGLAVAQEQAPLPVVGPLQRPDLALSAAGEQQQADERDVARMPFFMVFEHLCETAKLRLRKKSLPSLAPVAPDAGAGIAVLRAVAVNLRLAHDDGEDRRGPVRRHRRCVQRAEPALHVLSRDVGYVHPAEPGKDRASKIFPVDLHGSGLPVPPVAGEDFLGHGLEKPVFGKYGGFVAADGGKQFRCLPTSLVEAHAAGVADGLPEAPALVLAVDEEALGSRRQNADAEAFQLCVADIVRRLPGFKGLDPALAEADIGHGFPPASICRRGRLRLQLHPRPAVARGKTVAISTP